MNPLNLATTSSPPPVANDLLAKRKRGRPRKDETTTQPQQENINLVGKTFSGAATGSFDAGYLLNVKMNDSDTKLRGLVFKKGKVTPVTPENDVAPHVKMFAKEGIKNQTDLPPNDQPTEDVEICESARPLSLVPYQSDDEEPEEAVMEEKEKDGVMEEGEAATPLLEFFPTPETTMVTPQHSLVLAQKETTEQQKPPGEACGFGVEEPVGTVEKVPQELRLELGNKMIMSGDNKNGTGPNTSMSKSGFIANLLEGEGKKVDCAMEEEAAPSVP
ncbi:unnamed protein product [Brassica rapa]|uniref:Uncharacterized protein n=2 Tax=Brassica TaxID=3705 RepID=A0A3P5Z4H6_BRACM|nr:unnamed protein product [Brassica napus]CAG7887243.1 unnamed protein product [Brassica rapa]VDC74762.1 unnamed protein product [Brassica rapa]